MPVGLSKQTNVWDCTDSQNQQCINWKNAHIEHNIECSTEPVIIVSLKTMHRFACWSAARKSNLQQQEHEK